jgi:molybdenum-dependent DNA-binding transcriptional regulator ModE
VLIEEILVIIFFTLLGAITGAAIFPRLFRKTSIRGQEHLIKPFKAAKSELQALQFEKSLISQAVTRVYEAFQEGKIDKNEFERLLLKYKHQLASYDEKIRRLGPLVDFAEISEIRENTISILNERIGSMDQKLAEVCKKSGMSYTDISKIIKKMQQPQSNVEDESRKSKDKGEDSATNYLLTSERHKTKQQEVVQLKAEEKDIDKLQVEIMDALSRLEQINIDKNSSDSQDMNAFSTLNDKSCLRQFR